MRKSDKKLCTSITTGKVIQLKVKGLDMPTMITVSYSANGNDYQITESLKLKSKAIKIGFLPIGQKKISVIEHRTGVEVIKGCEVKVNYNPNTPSMAYITDNIGIVNV